MAGVQRMGVPEPRGPVADAMPRAAARPARHDADPLSALSGMLNAGPRVQAQMVLQRKLNDAADRTGLPAGLKAGAESLSGLSLDNVRVHYNSPRPAQLRAEAFTQGSEVHVAPGAERHLPHETWHVVQQMQGRVPATGDVAGVPLNDDKALEREADAMGAQAVQRVASGRLLQRRAVAASGRAAPVQRMVSKGLKRGARVVVNDIDNKDNPDNGKLGVILAPYQADPFDNRKGAYSVQIPGLGVVDFNFDQLNKAKPGTKVEGFLESDLEAPSEDSREEPWTVAEAKGLQQVSYNLLKLYSPDKFAYVAVGNSPALVMEFIHQESQSEEWQKSEYPKPTILPLPMSKVGAESYIESREDQGRKKNMDAYLEQFVSKEKLAGKTPVLVDYSSGQSLRIVALHLQAYLKAPIATANLRVGGDVQPDQGLGEIDDLVLYSKETEKESTQRNLEGYLKEAEDFGPLKSADPGGSDAEAFLTGLLDRRWKTNFGYRAWKDTIYEDVLKGRAEPEADEEGLGRVGRDVALIREALKMPENR